ncbi:MAG: sugar transferase [Planctomycetes bacterium]|nr:sugar transferase [Planctomycetota bacterium]
MFLRRHFVRAFTVSQLVVDALAIYAAFLAGYETVQLFYSTNIRWPASEYNILFIWILVITIATFAVMGMYSTRKSLLNVVEFERLGKCALFAFMLVSAIVFLLRQAPAGSKAHPILTDLQNLIFLDTEHIGKGSVVFTYGYLFILVAAERFVFFKLMQEAHRRGIGHHHVLIIGAGRAGRKIREKLIISPTVGWNMRGFLDDDINLVGTSVEGAPVLGTTDELEQFVSDLKIHTVFISIPEGDEFKILELVRRCRALGVEVCIVPRLWHILTYPVKIERLDSIPLIVPRKNSARISVAAAKRAIDIVIAGASLVLCIPFFILVPIVIKLESSGPAFFRQRRVGKDGREFEMLKFRTMHAEMSGDALKPQTSSDPRITKFGKFLRRTSVDEMPQFWNVLMGEMSMVGPRPEMPFIVESYTESDRARLSVKPGITGLWQISYARLRPIHANLDYDLYYVEHQSLLLDIIILILTPFALVKGTGAH